MELGNTVFWLCLWLSCGVPNVKVVGNRCPVGFVLNRANCYHHFTVKKKWRDAQTSCENIKSNLSSIIDQEELDYLKRVADQEKQWVGLRPSDATNIQSDALAKRRRGWVWIDGSRVTVEFIKWKSGEPSKGKTCARLESSGQMTAIACADKQEFICKQKATPTTTTSTTTTTTTAPSTTSKTSATTTSASITITKPASTTRRITTEDQPPTSQGSAHNLHFNQGEHLNHTLRITLIVLSVVVVVMMVATLILGLIHYHDHEEN